jgi:3,4-dihydroxy 2-butanone 4-phosphate synthase/GTP cyclohydrolase II
MDGPLPSSLARPEDHPYPLASCEELVAEAKSGRMFILVDDEDRENEGDLIVPAQFATPSAINFMARYGCGLICLALTRLRVVELGLPPMSPSNGTRLETAFTVSIEAREGVTTGISAFDRARTIAVAIDPDRGRDAIVMPGHVFPLAARDGGTLVRAGHTEAAIDIARLAGLNPSGVICEIMNDDGTMARLPDLVTFARRHDLKIGTIADVIAHRRRTERLVRRVQEGVSTHLPGGAWKLVVYASTVDGAEHLALVKGDLSGPEPVLVRMHAVDMFDDLTFGPHGRALESALHTIARAGRGAAVLITDHRPTALSERVRQLADPVAPAKELRDVGVGAQILLDLGVKEMILLSNFRRAIIGLEGYGLNIVEQRAVTMGGDPPNPPPQAITMVEGQSPPPPAIKGAST